MIIAEEFHAGIWQAVKEELNLKLQHLNASIDNEPAGSITIKSKDEGYVIAVEGFSPSLEKQILEALETN